MIICLKTARRLHSRDGGSAGRLLFTLAVATVFTLALGPVGLSVLSAKTAFGIGIILGSLASTFLFRPSANFDSNIPENSGDFQLPQSQEGVPIPYIAGTLKTGISFLWIKNFRSEEVTESVVTPGGKGGRKKSSTQVVGYNHYVTFATALCLGPADCILSIYANEEKFFGDDTSTDNVDNTSLTIGEQYVNKGPKEIIHDGQTIAAGETFTATSTEYSFSSDNSSDGIGTIHHIYAAESTESNYSYETIKIGRKYFVRKGVVTYNGTQYGDGQSSRIFTGVSGQTKFTRSTGALETIVYEDYTTDIISNPFTVRVKVFAQNGGEVTYNGETYTNTQVITAEPILYPVNTDSNSIVVLDMTSGSSIYQKIGGSERVSVEGYSSVAVRGNTYSNLDVIEGQPYAATYWNISETAESPNLVTSYGTDICRTGNEKYQDFTTSKGMVRVYWGRHDQLPPNEEGGEFLSAEMLPDPNLSYPGICYLIFKDFDLGSFKSVPRLTVELKRNNGVKYMLELQQSYRPSDPANLFSSIPTSAMDVSPILAIYEILVSPDMGIYYPPSRIDISSFLSAASTLEAEGIRLSIFKAQATSGKDTIQDILKYIDAVMFEDGQYLKIKLIRDDFSSHVASGSLIPGKYYTNLGYNSITYNGVSYSNNESFLCVSGVLTYSATGSGKVIPVLSLDYSKVMGKVQITRDSSYKGYNEIVFSYSRRSNQYEQSFVPKRVTSFYNQNNNITSTRHDLPFVMTEEVLNKVIPRYMKRTLLSLAGLKCSFNRFASPLEPGDVFILTNIDHPEIDETDELFFRVGKITQDSKSETVYIEALEDFYAGFTGVIESSSPINSNTLSNILYLLPNFEVVELPKVLSPEEPSLAIVATRSQSIQIGYNGHVSLNGSSYTSVGNSSKFVVKGYLSEPYDITPIYDNSQTLLVDFFEGLSTDISLITNLIGLSVNEGLDSGVYLKIGEEYMQVISAYRVNNNLFSLSVIRGIGESEIVPHSVRSEVIIFTDTSGISVTDSDNYAVGNVVDVKAQAFSADSITDVTQIESKSITLSGKYYRPFGPFAARSNGQFFDAHYNSGSNVTLEWSLRSSNLEEGYGSSNDINTELANAQWSSQEITLPTSQLLYNYDDSGFEVDILNLSTLVVVRTIKSVASSGGSVVSTTFPDGVGSAIYTNADRTSDGLSDGFIARVYAVGKDAKNLGLRSELYAELVCHQNP